jgi:hypothetical protein
VEHQRAVAGLQRLEQVGGGTCDERPVRADARQKNPWALSL